MKLMWSLLADIALLRVDKKFVQTPNIKPIKLNFDTPNDELIGRKVTISGWGYSESSPTQPVNHLLKTTMTICDGSGDPLIPYDPKQLYLYNYYTFACSGDSGGKVLHHLSTTIFRIKF